MNAPTKRLFRTSAALVFALIAVHLGLLLASNLALHRAYALLRNADRPMVAAELVPPPVPASENAAPLYQSAGALLRSDIFGDTPLRDAVSSISLAYLEAPDSSQDMATLLNNETVQRALLLVERAAVRPSCRFDVYYDQGIRLSLDHQMEVLHLSHLLAAKAVFEARNGDNRQACETLRTALHVTEALRKEPFEQGASYRAEQLVFTLQALRQVFNQFPPDDETAAAFAVLLPSTDDVRDHFLRGLDGNRVFFAENNVLMKGNMGPPPADCDWRTYGMFALYRYAPVVRADHAAYLREMGRITRKMARPYWEFPAPPENFFEFGMNHMPWYSLNAQIALSLNPPYRKQMATAQAAIEITHTDIALLRHKLAHGAYPVTLADIDPKFLPSIPLDPFTGQPLVYRPEGTGFVLYSLGENLRDDNGTSEPPPPRDAKNGDIVWRMAF